MKNNYIHTTLNEGLLTWVSDFMGHVIDVLDNGHEKAAIKSLDNDPIMMKAIKDYQDARLEIARTFNDKNYNELEKLFKTK